MPRVWQTTGNANTTGASWVYCDIPDFWVTWDDTMTAATMTYTAMQLDLQYEPPVYLSCPDNTPLIREQHELARERDRERERELAAANQRATELLMQFLTDEQRRTYEESGYFDVRGNRSGDIYRIGCTGHNNNVIRILPSGARVRMCAHPIQVEWLPHADHWLGQKLTIENNEAEFMRVANIGDFVHRHSVRVRDEIFVVSGDSQPPCAAGRECGGANPLADRVPGSLP